MLVCIYCKLMIFKSEEKVINNMNEFHKVNKRCVELISQTAPTNNSEKN